MFLWERILFNCSSSVYSVFLRPGYFSIDKIPFATSLHDFLEDFKCLINAELFNYQRFLYTQPGQD